MPTKSANPEQNTPSKKAAHTAKWAIIMAKVRIRQAIAVHPWPHWHLLTFKGPNGSEATGVVDVIAVRKDHGEPPSGMKRGDLLQIILIQAKGGSAAMPTEDDAIRLRNVALHHRACGILLAAWKKGKAAQFFSLRPHPEVGSGWRKDWLEVEDLPSVFGRSKEVK